MNSTTSQSPDAVGAGDDLAAQSQNKWSVASFVSRFDFLSGLRGRLLALTVLFILLAEFLIFLPSVAKFRTEWMQERIQAAEIAALALEAAPDRMVSDQLADRLLQETQLLAVAYGDREKSELIFRPRLPITSVPVEMDIRNEPLLTSLRRTIEHALAPEGRILRIIQTPEMDSQGLFIDVMVPETALREDLLAYSVNILMLSLLISAVVGGLIYFAVFNLVVCPLMKITTEVTRVANAPGNTEPLKPSGRDDEIGKAESALANMQAAVSSSFRQQQRLAELGEAVAKISHDLRNSLAVARLATENFAKSDDPDVKSSTPRLERAIERAINLAEDTLSYGRDESRKTQPRPVALFSCVEEAVREGLSSTPDIDWLNDIDEEISVLTDPDHLHRIVANLSRNAGQAMDAHARKMQEPGLLSLSAIQYETHIAILIADNGPGVPEHVQENLFRPFSASNSKEGSGLGLAIARELARAMRGDVALVKSDATGATFEVRLPVVEA